MKKMNNSTSFPKKLHKKHFKKFCEYYNLDHKEFIGATYARVYSDGEVDPRFFNSSSLPSFNFENHIILKRLGVTLTNNYFVYELPF